jgi:hypothetical protein
LLRREDDDVEMLSGTPEHVPGGDGPRRYSRPLTPASKRSSIKSGDHPLPPLPHSAPLPDHQVQPIIASRHTSLTGASFPIMRGDREVLVNPTTNEGTISQRRLTRPDQGQGHARHGSVHSASEVASESSYSPALPSGVSVVSRRSISSLNSAASNFDRRAGNRSYNGSNHGHQHVHDEDDELPPLPGDHRNRSMQSHAHAHTHPRTLSISTDHTNGLAPPSSSGHSHHFSRMSTSSPHSISRSFASSQLLLSPAPEPQPTEISHRPFHLLRIFHTSMDPTGTGAYLTRSIHISPSIWRPSTFSAGSSSKRNGKTQNFKIPQQDTKARYIESLLLHLEIVRSAGIPLVDGIREYKYGQAQTQTQTGSGTGGQAQAQVQVQVPRAGEGAIHRAAEEFVQALDGLDEEMDQAFKVWSKAGIVTVGWKGKKASTVSCSCGSYPSCSTMASSD